MARLQGRRSRLRRLRSVALVGLLGIGATAVPLARDALLSGSTAIFSDTNQIDSTLTTGRIFRGERGTPAFTMTDVSSGTAVNTSSATAYVDGTYFLTRTWASTFDTARYIEADLNAPLPGGLAVSGAQLNLTVASDGTSGTACYYAEVRRISSGAVIATVGSSGSPAACVAGTTPTTHEFSVSALDATDLANDARVRIYGRDSGAGAIRLDAATISGSSPYASFTLYPVLTREVYSGHTDVIPWGLAGQ